MNDSNNAQHDGPGNGDLDADVIEIELAAMLADSSLWVEAPAGLGDRVAIAVQAEAGLGTPDPQVAGAEAVTGASDRPRNRLRPALVGAAAMVVFLFGGIVLLSALSGVDEVDTFSVELISTGMIPDVTGGVEITSFESGLQIDLSASGLPRRDDGAFYEGWVRTVDGNLTPVGTFHDGSAVTLWAGVELDRIDLFTVTLETAAGPDDPAQGSSGEVVLRAALTP